MSHICVDIQYMVFSFWLEPVKVEYYKYSWDFAAIFFDWEESQKGSVHKTTLCEFSPKGGRIGFLSSTLKMTCLETVLEVLRSTYEYWYFMSIEKYSCKCPTNYVKKFKLVFNRNKSVIFFNLPYETILDMGSVDIG